MPNADSTSYQEHLQRIHANRRVSRRTLLECLRCVSASPITSCNRLVEGETNEVYDVELADGLALILRIARSSPGAFDRERWAIESCRAKGIPVPEILSISQHDTESVPIQASVQRKVVGRLLARSEGRDQHQARLVRRCGELLREMHTIATTGFGYIDENGRGRFGAAREEAVDYRSLEPTLAAAAHDRGLDTRLFANALAFVVDMIETRQVQPCLLHNDFEPKHIMVDGQRVAAIIDFGESASGDPVNDLVRFSFFESGGPVLFEDLLAGYGPCDLSRLTAYRIGFSLFQIAGSHARGYVAGTLDGASRLRREWNRVPGRIGFRRRTIRPSPTSVVDARRGSITRGHGLAAIRFGATKNSDCEG